MQSSSALCSFGRPRHNQWRPFMFPSTLRIQKIDPDEWSPALRLAGSPGRAQPLQGPLGLSNVRLPVVHQAVFQHSDAKWWQAFRNHHVREKGIWFYHAPGCSDMLYDTGKTLAALNKVDAALRLARLVVGQKDASLHLSAWIRKGPLATGAMAKRRYRREFDACHGKCLVELLEEAAQGPFPLDPSTGKTTRAAAFDNPLFLNLTAISKEERRSPCVGSCALIEVAACLWLFEFLDPFLLETGRSLGLHSIQLLQSPQGGYGFFNEPHKWSGGRHHHPILDPPPPLNTCPSATLDARAHFDCRDHPSSPQLVPQCSRLGRLLTDRVSPPSVEIIDLSSSDEPASAYEERPRSLVQRLTGADGLPCVPGCFFACCMSCRNTPVTLRACLQQEAFVRLPDLTITARLPPGDRTMMVPQVAWCGSTCVLGAADAPLQLMDATRYLQRLQHVGGARLESSDGNARQGRAGGKLPLDHTPRAARNASTSIAAAGRHSAVGSGSTRHSAMSHAQQATLAASVGARQRCATFPWYVADSTLGHPALPAQKALSLIQQRMSCEEKAADRRVRAERRTRLLLSQVRRDFWFGAGVAAYVLPCSFANSRFFSEPSRCIARSRQQNAHVAASLLRWDLPVAIYTGGRLGGNQPVGSSLRIEPHKGEKENLDVGYSTAIGWLLQLPRRTWRRKGVAFAHDAWVENEKEANASRVPCAGRAAEEYAVRATDASSHSTHPHGGRDLRGRDASFA